MIHHWRISWRRFETDAGFAPQEVHDFREIFLSYVGTDKVLSLGEFADMFGNICPLGQKNSTILNGMWKQALHVYRSPVEMKKFDELDSDNVKWNVDFPEFLWLMKRLLESNFGNVLQRTQGRDKEVEEDLAPKAPARVKNDLRLDPKMAAQLAVEAQRNVSFADNREELPASTEEKKS